MYKLPLKNANYHINLSEIAIINEMKTTWILNSSETRYANLPISAIKGIARKIFTDSANSVKIKLLINAQLYINYVKRAQPSNSTPNMSKEMDAI